MALTHLGQGYNNIVKWVIIDMRYCFFIIFMSVTNISLQADERFNDVDLWLPTMYQEQWTAFFNAADQAKNDPYCFQLLSGRVLESLSTVEHMIFHFRCRTEDRMTFSIQVDGNSLEVTNIYGDKQRRLEEERIAEENRRKEEEERRLADEKAAEEQRKQEEELRLKEEEAAARRLEEQELAKAVAKAVAQRHADEKQYWNICREAMQKRLKNFEGITFLSDLVPEPQVQADQFTFTLLFNALNPVKKELHFKITCVISALDYYKVEIKPRGQENKVKP